MEKTYKTDDEYLMEILLDEEKKVFYILVEILSDEEKRVFYKYISVKNEIKNLKSKNNLI